ncbi:MAG: segregation/condensation protein A [Oscillospiraceae bacterium]|nr:segregation/condensation protein A [Oscillospiraceae bacterium]
MDKPTFHLEGIIKTKGETRDFEGPLNLILMLLSRNRVEIRDIRISDIVEQYNDYIAGMRELDLNTAGEFVQMASYLVYIKAKSLLKKDNETVNELELLMSTLEEMKCRDTGAQIKYASERFEALISSGALMQTKAPEQISTNKTRRYSHETKDLLEALFFIFSRNRVPDEPVPEELTPPPEMYSIEDKSRMLTEYLKTRGAKTIRELCDLCADRSEIVAAFVSVLELCVQGIVSITEKNGEFLVKLTETGVMPRTVLK